MKLKLLIAIITVNFCLLMAQQSTTGPVPANGLFRGNHHIDYKSQVIIPNVPSYIWRHGCGPTALGMVIGYYDTNSFSDLIPGSSTSQTNDVNAAIANNEHYSDYSLPEDEYPNLELDKSSTGGAHQSNCIGDFMRTSWSSEDNYYGWSWSNDIGSSFVGYINYKNPDYEATVSYETFSGNSWDVYKNEINNQNPVVVLVDSDGDGNTDHFVTGIGYDNSNNQYAIYDTWDHNVHWFDWREMSSNYSWGVCEFAILHISLEPQLPDYKIASITCGMGPYQQGDDINISSVINNIGTGNGTTPIKVGYYFSANENGTDYYAGNADCETLNAGESSNISTSITVPTEIPDGEYRIVFWADYEDVENESNEDNNMYSSFKITISNGGNPVVILDESFEGGSLPTGWTNIDSDGDTYKWQIGEDPSMNCHTGSYCFTSASWDSNAGALNPDNWLVTPQLNLGANGNINYWVCGQDATYAAEHYGVYISTTGTSTSNFALLFEETIIAKKSKGTGAYYEKNVSLADYSGNVYLAFRHFNVSDMFMLNIDDIKVESDSPNAIGNEGNISKDFTLCQNYPNPFNPNTTIKFNLTEKQNVKLTVCNVNGQLVKSLVNERLDAGLHQINFDGSNLNSGVYYYQLNADGKSYTKKMLLVK